MNLLEVLPVVTNLIGIIQKDLEDGKIDFAEGVSLFEYVAKNAEKFFPALAPEATLVLTICGAIESFGKAKAAAAPKVPVVKVSV